MNNQTQSPEVIVFEASAGSGKTYALAKRYLTLLINPNLRVDQIPLHNILAITFTNKATVEMKERILEFLKRIALDIFESKEQQEELLGILGVSKNEASVKAKSIMNELISNYTFFQVQTIDSFINAILMGCACHIDRSSQFKIKHDYTRYLSYCLDDVIDMAAGDKNTLALLEDFLEHYLFVENKNSWFPKKDILGSIQSLFKLSNQRATPFYIYKGSSQDVIKKKISIFKAIEEILQELPQDLDTRVKKSIQRFISQEPVFELKNLPERFRYLQVPMNKGKVPSASLVKKWQAVHNKICDLADLDANVAYSPYLELFEKISQCFNKICKHDDILFLGELNSKARLLFSEEGITLAELYYRLATRFTHYLIDEFQDTSKLQWQNLEEMVREAISCGGSLFYVGDKKQAIYRFRGGAPELFDEVKEQFRDYVKPQILTKNWRSQKEIVEFNNEIFSKENLSRAILAMDNGEDIDDKNELLRQVLNVFSDSRQQYVASNNQGYVYVERIEENKKEAHNEAVKEKIISLVEGLRCRFLSYKGIAILCRDNDEVELVTSWLIEKGITVESEKTLSIEENNLVQELVSFLKFLHSPIDELSFASFILGEIFTKASGIGRDEITSFIFELRKEQNKNDSSLYRQFRQAYPEVWQDYLEQFFKGVGFISPYELVVSIYERFSLLKNFSDNQAFFMKFLELIKQQEDEYSSLTEFLTYLDSAPKEELYIKVDETESVHVLTIHKAKGLEFNVVIMPFLRIDINAQTAEMAGSYLTEEGGLVRITKEHRKYSSRLKEIYKKAYIQAAINEFNNLYVGLTRPKFELYLFIPKKSRSSANKANYLIPQELKERGRISHYPLKPVSSRPILNLKPSGYKDWVSFMKDEFGEETALKNREKILEGNAIHFALSYIDNLYRNEQAALVDKAIENTKIQYPLIADFNSLRTKILKIINDKEIIKFFYVTAGQIYREKEIVNIFGESKRIDRLIVKEKEVWVIDYKSSPGCKQEYQKQVRQYLEAIGRIYRQKSAKGFIVYLNEASIEEVGL
jgi:ATP-dependent exoDNAse (exonuclease V) beta subunit